MVTSFLVAILFYGRFELKIAVLGGTRFVGRHIVETLIQRGIKPVLFHRGVSGAGLFLDLEHRKMDRRQECCLDDAEAWDAVIDTCAYRPEDLVHTSKAFQNCTRHYVYVSTISVYGELSQPLNEDSPLLREEDLDDPYNGYGAGKVICERLLGETFEDRLLVLRPGILAGPWDPTDRFTWWLRELRQNLLHHGLRPEQPVQFLDARDFGAFIYELLMKKTTGIFNVTGPREGYTGQDFLHDLAPKGASPPSYSDDIALLGSPFSIHKDNQALFEVNPSKALAAGLKRREVSSTVRDTLEWMRAEGIY